MRTSLVPSLLQKLVVTRAFPYTRAYNHTFATQFIKSILVREMSSLQNDANTPEKRTGSPSLAAISDANSKQAKVEDVTKSMSKGPKNQKKFKKKQHQQAKKKLADPNILNEIEGLFKRLSKKKNGEELDFAWKAEEKVKESEWCRSPPVPDVWTAIREINENKVRSKDSNDKEAAPATGDKEDESKVVSPWLIDAHILGLTAGGIGLASIESKEDAVKKLQSGERIWIFTVPFVLPDEIVHVKVFRNQWGYSQCDLVSIVKESAERVEAPCKYFTKCSGCQLQHWGYENQLKFKKRLVANAFASADKFLAGYKVLPVISSPESFNYRTKLTPHFDIPKAGLSGDQVVPIGFNHYGRRQIMDIEQCIIGTEAVNKGLLESRKKTLGTITSYKRGATLLVRETNKPVAKEDDQETPISKCVTFEKDYVLDPKAQVTEVVDGLKFQFPASSFFQNNNIILPAFTGFVRDELDKLANLIKEHKKQMQGETDGNEPWSLQCLVDAYCGAGLFGIACSKGFEKVIGIEISKESISCANNNAKMNNITNCDFMLGDATHIFKEVPYDCNKTAVIIDPPRKGSNPEFLDQLIQFKPAVIIYVACGVPAQARDLKYMLDQGALVSDIDILDAKLEESSKAADSISAKYKIMSIQPFDLFPQTAHVENIVSLVRADLVL